MNKTLKAGSILDLPIERQREIAKEEGMEFEEWVTTTKERLAKTRAFVANIKMQDPVFTDDYTKEDHERFAKRMASCDVGIRSGSI